MVAFHFGISTVPLGSCGDALPSDIRRDCLTGANGNCSALEARRLSGELMIALRIAGSKMQLARTKVQNLSQR